ncbi:hypothetical protein GCM10009624_15180 [Gordonia sinesedis]
MSETADSFRPGSSGTEGNHETSQGDTVADNESWRLPAGAVPDSYPTVIGGPPVHFSPRSRPDVTTRIAHILDGDASGGGHRSGCGLGKAEFPPMADIDLMRLIDTTLAAPVSVERRGSTLYFRRLIDAIPMEVLVAARKPAPTLRTAYPNWPAAARIAAGKDRLLWVP